MVEQLGGGHELFAADVADKHLDAGVDLLVLADGAQLEESLLADGARVRPVAGVSASMGRQAGTGDETLTAHVADERTEVSTAAAALVEAALVEAEVGRVSEPLSARPTRRGASGASVGVVDGLVPLQSRGRGTVPRTDTTPQMPVVSR